MKRRDSLRVLLVIGDELKDGPQAALDSFAEFNRPNLAKDRDGDPVFMAKSPWDVGYQQEKNPELTFSATKER